MKRADRATINERERKLGGLSLKNIIKKEIRNQKTLAEMGVIEAPGLGVEDDEAYDYVYGWYDDYRP